MIPCPHCKTLLNIGKLLASLPITPAKQRASRINGRKGGKKKAVSIAMLKGAA